MNRAPQSSIRPEIHHWQIVQRPNNILPENIQNSEAHLEAQMDIMIPDQVTTIKSDFLHLKLMLNH